MRQAQLPRGGGLQHYILATYSTVLTSFPRQINTNSTFDSCDTKDTHSGWRRQRPTRDLNDPPGLNNSKEFKCFGTPISQFKLKTLFGLEVKPRHEPQASPETLLCTFIVQD